MFAGDWHGNLLRATSCLQSIGSSWGTTILHVGDFGIWPGSSGKRYLQAVENTCAPYDLNFMITPGTHGDWARLATRWAATLLGVGDDLSPFAADRGVAGQHREADP